MVQYIGLVTRVWAHYLLPALGPKDLGGRAVIRT